MDRKSIDILIAGGGIAGLTAAAAFGAAGFSVVCIDPMAQTIDRPDQRTTAFLQPATVVLATAGLWDRLAPHATPLRKMRIVDASGAVVTRDFDAADLSDAPFGWNLPNGLLRRAMLARLAELPGVDFCPGVGFRSMLARENYALVTLSDGSQVAARLVIGADGRDSVVRQAAGIGVNTMRYGQKALVFAVTHGAPHQDTSTEIHRAGGPFTLVPLPDQQGRPCSSVVWMDHGAAVLRRAAVSADAFEAEATDRSAHLFGPLTLASPRQVWPIISQLADTMSGPRIALMAEAAHVLPPIGAQGLNMSLADLACLLELAVQDPKALGSRAMLDRYHARRHPAARLRVAGIDVLNRASMAGLPVAQRLRAFGIKALHDVAPVRHGLMQFGMRA